MYGRSHLYILRNTVERDKFKFQEEAELHQSCFLICGWIRSKGDSGRVDFTEKLATFIHSTVENQKWMGL